MYSKDLLDFREALNTSLSRRLMERYGQLYFAEEIFKRIEKGRKIRSFLFLTVSRSLGCKDEGALLDVCLSIEMTHAASVLVDDILDGDDVRHGHQSSHAKLGTPASTLEAHFLCAEAISLLNSKPKLLDRLIETYKRATLGEMYDIFMPEPVSEWICNGYNEQIYQKTSALFEYSLVGASLVSKREDLEQQLKAVGHAIGRLYQLSNDFHDLQPDNLRKRHASNRSWRITYSFPLAVYLQLHGMAKVQETLNRRMLTYNQWMKFLEVIWTKEVQELAKKTLIEAETNAKNLIETLMLPAEVNQTLFSLIELISDEHFWYHTYNAQQESKNVICLQSF